MRIVCTFCKTTYKVDILKIQPGGIEFKCAKCLQFFFIGPQDIKKTKPIESNKKTLVQINKEFNIIKEKNYGKTKIIILKKN